MNEERSGARRKPGPQPESPGALRISAAHRGNHVHDKRGGFAVGPGRARAAGALGGAAVKERYGTEHFQRLGALGGRKIRDKLGRDHLAAIGRLGGLRKKKRAE